MKFGVFYEHQLPRPWDAGSELQLMQDALDQIELADKLGFHAVWEVEHHFLELFGTEVLPEFAERDAAQEAARAKRLEPIIEAASCRKAGLAVDA